MCGKGKRRGRKEGRGTQVALGFRQERKSESKKERERELSRHDGMRKLGLQRPKQSQVQVHFLGSETNSTEKANFINRKMPLCISPFSLFPVGIT